MIFKRMKTIEQRMKKIEDAEHEHLHTKFLFLYHVIAHLIEHVYKLRYENQDLKNRIELIEDYLKIQLATEADITYYKVRS